MMQEAPREETSKANHDVFESLENYSWDDDPEFQRGLASILGQSPSSEQVEQLTREAKCFYFSRKRGVPIDVNAYKAWQAGLNSSADATKPAKPSVGRVPSPSHTSRESAPTHGTESVGHRPSDSRDDDAPFPTSFAHIVDLISKGETVPGIKDIPETVLEGSSSQSTSLKRKKPWEKTGHVETTEDTGYKGEA